MDQRLPKPAATDWRALCEELADALDHNRQCLLDDSRLTHPLADRARAALAEGEVEKLVAWLREQATWFAADDPDHENYDRAADLLLRQAAPVPVAERLPGPEDCDGRDPECVKRWPDCFDGGYHPSCCRFPKSCSCGPRARTTLAAEPDGPAVPESREPASVVGEPSDEELLELWQGWNLGWDPQKGMVLMPHPAEYARAVLARWGRPSPAPAEGERQAAPVPAEGEVADYADFVAWLVSEMPAGTVISDPLWWAPRIARRAADLLEQRHPAPVPVAERLPGPEDCDAEGRCWWWRTDDADEWWELLCISDAREYNAGCGNARYTHWLSYPSFPLPDQE